MILGILLASVGMLGSVGKLMGPVDNGAAAPPVETFRLVTQAGDPIVTQAGDYIVTGAP